MGIVLVIEVRHKRISIASLNLYQGSKIITITEAGIRIMVVRICSLKEMACYYLTSLKF